MSNSEPQMEIVEIDPDAVRFAVIVNNCQADLKVKVAFGEHSSAVRGRPEACLIEVRNPGGAKQIYCAYVDSYEVAGDNGSRKEMVLSLQPKEVDYEDMAPGKPVSTISSDGHDSNDAKAEVSVFLPQRGVNQNLKSIETTVEYSKCVSISGQQSGTQQREFKVGSLAVGRGGSVRVTDSKLDSFVIADRDASVQVVRAELGAPNDGAGFLVWAYGGATVDLDTTNSQDRTVQTVGDREDIAVSGVTAHNVSSREWSGISESGDPLQRPQGEPIALPTSPHVGAQVDANLEKVYREFGPLRFSTLDIGSADTFLGSSRTDLENFDFGQDMGATDERGRREIDDIDPRNLGFPDRPNGVNGLDTPDVANHRIDPDPGVGF
jgi:hypothetical protein